MKKPYEIIVIVLLLVISACAHGWNMFHYPYYENDEGTYMSQAWSATEHGELAPYTYWYDHAPAGWLFIGAWAKLTGGYHTFGEAVASGRVFMLLLHVIGTYLLYFIVRRMSGSVIAGAIAALLFSLSPLGLYFQRRILLDNIMVFWTLLSIAVLMVKDLKLRHVSLSAIFFGIAILSKENAVFLTPAYLYAVFARSHVMNRIFSVVQWMALMGCTVLLYPIYALLKSEFFPPGEGAEHVSLLDTLAFHASRGTDFPFWDFRSEIYNAFLTWMDKDPYIMIIGSVCSILLVLGAIFYKPFRFPALLVFFTWAFLLRGGLILDFYVAGLTPFLAMASGIVIARAVAIVSFKNMAVYGVLGAVAVVATVWPSYYFSSAHFTNDEVTPFTEALEWVKENVPEDSYIIIDQSAYLELRNPKDDVYFDKADWFWKVESDPEIRFDRIGNSWKNVDYIFATHEFMKQIEKNNVPFVKEVLEHSTLVKQWGPPEGSGTHINLEQYISTNGDWAMVYKVKDEEEAATDQVWDWYIKNYIKDYGQVIDPYQDDRTVSEGQAYGMLRAVWMDDEKTFDGLWQWTKDHLQYRENDKLISWLWEKDDTGKYGIGDSSAATDADIDMALALLFAHKEWGNDDYLADAKTLIDDLWEHAVVQVGSDYYLAPLTTPERDTSYLLNPSYFSPAMYRIFASVDEDPTHKWEAMIESTYDLLDTMAGSGANPQLLPNWITMHQRTGRVSTANAYVASNPDIHSYDAFRIFYRVALDAQWFDEPRAKAYIQKYGEFFKREWESDHYGAEYRVDGTRVNNNENISTDTALLIGLMYTDPDAAEEVFQKRFQAKYDEEGFWGDKNNYYGQNWAWFSTMFYRNSLPNLWRE